MIAACLSLAATCAMVLGASMQRDWSLIIGNEPGLFAGLLLALCVGLALAELVLGLRREVPRARAPRRRRALVGATCLRLIALAALVAVVLELGVRVETYAGLGRRVVVLVDRSASMDIADGPASAEPGEDTTRRFDRLRELWQDSSAVREGWREQGIELELRSFAETTETLSADQSAQLQLEPTGRASELGRALLELREADSSDGAPLAGVVVLSDGLVTRDDASREHLGDIVDSLGLPLTAVSAGGPTLRDVSISALHVGEFAFVENVTEFSVELVAHGCAGETVGVELLRDGESVTSRMLSLGNDGEPRELSFEVAPDRTGQFVYEFRVAPLAGEASVVNNRRAFVVKVLRDKVRVLHVAGRPDWDVRALRTLLKRDPNVELLSYYILRDMEDTARDDGTAPLSLIAFPTEQLFREELGSFDLIVMHNFDAATHGDYLGNVAQYVREGGSLVVIGGDLGLGSGDFAVASISRLMPIDLPTDLGRALELDREPFSPQLSEAGRRHPITAWLAEAGRGDWHGLPPLDSFNAASPNREGAAIDAASLLVHPSRTTPDGRPLPLLAVSEPGKGRVMTLTTGSSWRLGFAPDLPLIDGARPYDLLWLGAVRWLLRDASAERLSLEIEQDRRGVDLSVRTLSASYAPEPEVEVEYEIRELDGSLATAPAPLQQGRLTTDGLGRAATHLTPLPDGAYQAEAWRSDAPPRPATKSAEASPPPETAAAELGQSARRVFLVGGDARELARVDADAGIDTLERLAERSGGTFVELIAGAALPESLPLAALERLERPPTGRSDVPVWDHWLALLIALAAFGGEWIIRRLVLGEV